MEYITPRKISMISPYIIDSLLWLLAISSALMAGVYFAFSMFVIQSFNTLETKQAVNAMNAINKTILRSLFMPIFFISTLLSLSLIIVALIQWPEKGTAIILLAGITYFVGMFICTIVYNVPLNNALKNVDIQNNDQTVKAWEHYFTVWTRWNHLRTVSALICNALCILALVN
jgi:uncharacterized membrane protein